MKVPSTTKVLTPIPSRRRAALLAAIVCLFTTAALSAQYAPNQNQDPPSRVARVAFAQGNVSLEQAGTDSFGSAEINYPLSAGDRLYADVNSISELQTSGLAVRLGNGADLTITTLTDGVAQFALAQGSVRIRTRDLYAPPAPDGSPQQGVVEIDTPNATILVQQPGDIRIDSYPQDGSTIVTVSSGLAEVSGQDFDQTLSGNQALQITGFGPVNASYVGLLPPDNLDRFDSDREQMHMHSVAFRNQYVDPNMIGAADLDEYGDWQPTPQYGPIWFPRNVAYGWTPYSVGHWANVAPWGYTWVDTEPWGFAPFHYGRWTNFNGRWGWVPGPPPSVFRGPGWGGPPPRPVYSPALVAFVGGANFSISIGGGVGVTAWFPLGPSEPYVPWYHTSPAYVNRVNVTNIYTTNVTQIHNTYVNRSVTVYNVTNVTYVNRTQATVAVNQQDFAAGHSVARSQPVVMNAAAKQQLTQAPVLQHAVAAPPRIAAPPQAPARAVPATTARPVVQTKQGFQRAGAPPSATPLRAPTPPPSTPAARAAMPQQRPTQVIAPAKPSTPAPPAPVAAHPPARTPPPPPPTQVRPATPANAPEPKPVAPAPQVRPAPAAPANVPEPRPVAPAPQVRPAPAAPARAPEPRPATPPPAVVRPATPPPVPQRPVEQPRPQQPPPAAHPAPPPPRKTPPPPPKDEKPKDEKPN
jgi:hypothetical protein